MPPARKRSAKKGPRRREPSESDCAAEEREFVLPNAPTIVCSDDGLRMVNAEEAQNELDKLCEKKKTTPEGTTLDDLRDLSIRAGQHGNLYLEARRLFDATDYWYDKYMDEDHPHRAAFDRLLEGYKHVAHAWVELGDSRKCNKPFTHWTRICFHDADSERYVQAIEEHARHLEEEAWHAMTFPLVADVFGEQPISDGRLVQMLCVFVVQTFLPEELSVVTDCTMEEMVGMLQFAWKYLVTLGRLVTFVDIRNVVTNASAYVAWSRCNGWRYAVPFSTWGSVGEWFSRLQYFSTSGKTPSFKRSPNGVPTNALIDLVYQAKAMGKMSLDSSVWRKAIDPLLFVECTRRPDVIHLARANISKQLRLPLTTTSRPEEIKVMLQAVGLRLQEPDAAAWFKDTCFEARWHVCVLNLADPSGALVNLLSSAIIAWTHTCREEMQRARQLYGNTIGRDSASIASIVPEWGYAVVDEVRAANTSVEVGLVGLEQHITAPHIPRAFTEAHGDAVKLGVRQPMAMLSGATLTRPEERVNPIVVAQVQAMLRRSRFASSVEEAIEGSKPRTEPFAWQRGAPFAFRLFYCAREYSALPSFGSAQLCEDLLFLTQTRDLEKSVVEATAALVDEAALVRPEYTFAKSGLVQRRMDVPGIGLWVENPKAFRTWIWECCMGIVELVYPGIEARNAKGIPFHDPDDLYLLRSVDDSVVDAFCLPVQACTSAQELRAKIKAALRQSLVAVAARLTACKTIGDPVYRPKLRSMLGWQWPDDQNQWRIIEPVYFYEWPMRYVDSKTNAMTASLTLHPYRMPKALARRYIAERERTNSVAAHGLEVRTWKRCLEAAPAGSRFCGNPCSVEAPHKSRAEDASA